MGAFGNFLLLTEASTTEDAARLGGRRRRWGILSRMVSIAILFVFTHLAPTTATFDLTYLNLRGSGRPRCAHGISSMHDGETDYRNVIELGGEQQQQEEQQQQRQSTPRSKAKLC